MKNFEIEMEQTQIEKFEQQRAIDNLINDIKMVN